MAGRRAYPDQYMLRFPEGLRDTLKAEAAKNTRSMNAEIIARLEQSLSGGNLPETIKQALREVLDERT